MGDLAGGTRFRNLLTRFRFSPVTQDTVKTGVTLKKRKKITVVLCANHSVRLSCIGSLSRHPQGAESVCNWGWPLTGMIPVRGEFKQ